MVIFNVNTETIRKRKHTRKYINFRLWVCSMLLFRPAKQTQAVYPVTHGTQTRKNKAAKSGYSFGIFYADCRGGGAVDIFPSRKRRKQNTAHGINI
jgi:hypothetical protein